MDAKHKFIFEYAGMKFECYNTQKEIAEKLSDPSVKLISVNDGGYRGTRQRKQTKRKDMVKNV